MAHQRPRDGRGDTASFVLTFAVIVAAALAGVAGLLTLLGWDVAADTVALVLLGVVLVLGVVFFASLRSRAR
jgi:hypothetical protein